MGGQQRADREAPEGDGLGEVAPYLRMVDTARRTFVTGHGAFSTTPQKRNPISSEFMLAASKGLHHHAGLMRSRGTGQLRPEPCRTAGLTSGGNDHHLLSH